jgi:hypothetical protein
MVEVDCRVLQPNFSVTEHPPLVKLLAAIPLLPLGLEEPPPIPVPFFKTQDLINGALFLYPAGVDGNALLFRGRVVIMLFSLGLGLLLFLATREIFGPLATAISSRPTWPSPVSFLLPSTASIASATAPRRQASPSAPWPCVLP